MTGQWAPPPSRDPLERTHPDPPRPAYRGAHRERFEQTQRDPFEETRREEPAAEQEAEPGERERMRPRDRRIVQAIALLTVVPTLLVVQWVDQSKGARKLEPAEKATEVPRGGTGDLANARWKVANKLAGKRPPLGAPPDVAEMRVTLAVQPANAAAVRNLSYGVTYQLRDTEGHTWSATGLAAPARPGVPLQITVRAVLPRSKLRSVTLEVRPRAAPAKGPRPLLRFAP